MMLIMKNANKYLSLLILTILCLCNPLAQAQELHCTVNINTDQIEGSNKQMFQTLQQTITEFVNTTQWTTLVFSETERIECTMMLIINSVTTEGMVDAIFQVQSRRPVYGTTYTTPLLNLRDNDFSFRYQEYDRMDFQPAQVTNNLTALIAYYCYLIIGFDMDSYSRMGGTPCFQRCEEIVNTARSSSLENAEMNGWKAFGSNHNRYTLISNLMDEAFKSYRNYFYDYHRLGLDVMSNNVANGRATIAQGMPVLREAYKARPASYVVSVFLDAKNDEITNIFQKASSNEKKEVLEVLEAVDPTRMSTVYEKINQ